MTTQASCTTDSEFDIDTGRLSTTEKTNGNIEGDLNTRSEIGVILPTYCESANVEKLIREIESLNLKTSILVIDDSSPDGTANIVRRLQQKYKSILLYVRFKKTGLGTAITDGFRTFLSLRHPPRYIITMDADYSHSPQEIPKLIRPMKHNSDLVIGSRYCEGGNTKNWSIMRLIVSKTANLVATLRIRADIHDYTSGFRCYSLKLIEKTIGDLHSQTYEIQIETIRQARIKGFKITETPITFVNRKKGKSKLSANEIRQFISYAILKR